jgi:N-glycosylase/DNA lyase
MVKGLREIRFELATTPFNLNYTLTCGQTFRWERHKDWWHGVVRETFFKIRQIGGVLQFQTFPENVDDAFIWSYFRLDDDLLKIYSRIEKDRHIREAVKKFSGLRLMRQDPWDCLISYICATNTNIPAIEDMINNMCIRFGKRITIEGAEVFTFPKPNDLAKATLKELGLCKLGFRAERVKQTSELISDGSLNLEALKKMPYEKAKKELLSLPGVGPKVADCVLLFSLDKLEAFPIDVWMKRAISEFYRKHFEKSFVEKIASKKSISPSEYEIISSFGRQYFGEYVGYAQEYLFHYKRCQQ